MSKVTQAWRAVLNAEAAVMEGLSWKIVKVRFGPNIKAEAFIGNSVPLSL